MKNINSKRYWRYVKFIKNLGFTIKKLLFLMKSRYRNSIDEVKIDITLSKYIFKDGLKSTALVAVMLILEKTIYACFDVYNSNIVIQRIRNFLNFDYNSFINYVIAIIGVTGVFLGLYFATIGNIIASTYSNLPRELSKIFENEKLGNKYIRALVEYLLICLMVLFLNIIGVKTLSIVTLVITFLGIKTILNFTILGKRLFEFSDFFSITNSIYPVIYKSIKMASIEGYACEDISFQSHYHINCQKQLELLEEVACIGISHTKDKYNSVNQFLKNNLISLSFYTKSKCKIPYSSKWYADKYSYDSWFLAKESTVNTALSTGTFIPYSTVADRAWFESYIMQINEKILLHALENNNSDLINTYLSFFSTLCRQLVTNLELDIYSNATSKFQIKIHDYIIKSSNFSLEDCLFNRDASIGTVELISYSYINLILGIHDNLYKLTDDNLELFVDKVNWADANSIFKFDLPFKSYETIEDLRTKLIFEMQVENRIVSPKWYIKQLITLQYFRIIDNIIEVLKDTLNKQFLELSIMYYENKKYVHSFMIITAGIECHNKLSNLLFELENIYNKLNGNRVEKAIPWVEIDFKNIEKENGEVYNKLIEEMAKNILQLIPYNRDKSFPDIFGCAYNYISEELFCSIINLDEKYFAKLYPFYLKICFLIEKNIIRELEEHSAPIFKMLMPLSCIIDFMALSGHAIYMSELVGNDSMKNLIVSICDIFFDNMTKDKEAILERLEQIYKVDNDFHNMNQRSIIRTRWRQRFKDAIINKNLVERDSSHAHFYDERIKHNTPLIKCFDFSYSYGFNTGFEEIFLELYVNQRISDLNNKFKSRSGWTKRYYEMLSEGGDYNKK